MQMLKRPPGFRWMRVYRTGGLIDKPAGNSDGKKPGTYREQAKKRYLNLTRDNNRARSMETRVWLDSFLEQKISI
jgi:hypothetical protein